MTKEKPMPSLRSQLGLDAAAFCVTDIANGLGAFTATYLQADRHWDPVRIGTALSAAGIAAMVTQMPAAALLDVIVNKKNVLIYSSLVVAASALGIVFIKPFAATIAFEALIGATTTFIAPVIAAISLGLVGHLKFDARMGRTSAYSHGGNVVAAALAGWLGFAISQAWVFYLIAILNVMTVFVVLLIRGEEIDFDIARGGDGANQDKGDRSLEALWTNKTSEMKDALKDSKMLLLGCAFFSFQLAGAGILPLIGQSIGSKNAKESAMYMAAAIIIAQMVMIPASWGAGRLAGIMGRKWLLLIGLGCVPLRALLCALSANPIYLVSLQALDGASAGIFNVVSILMISDLTKGTTRFNSMQGFGAMAMGLGAGLSSLLAGFVAKSLHFPAAFTTLALIGIAATAAFIFLLPETQIKS